MTHDDRTRRTPALGAADMHIHTPDHWESERLHGPLPRTPGANDLLDALAHLGLGIREQRVVRRLPQAPHAPAPTHLEVRVAHPPPNPCLLSRQGGCWIFHPPTVESDGSLCARLEVVTSGSSALVDERDGGRLHVVLLAGASLQTFSERQVKPANRLLPFLPARTPEGRRLLLVHGLLSTIESTFSGLRGSPPDLERLHQAYPGGIWGWDHRTLEETPLHNAQELAAHLADPALGWLNAPRIDLLTHSRGTAVARALLEHPSLDHERSRLPLRWGKAIFVAGPIHGTEVGTPRRRTGLFNLMLVLLQQANARPEWLRLVGSILCQGDEAARQLPGIAPLERGSTFLRELEQGKAWPLSEGVQCVLAFRTPSSNPSSTLFQTQSRELVGPVPGDGMITMTSAGRFGLRRGEWREFEPLWLGSPDHPLPGVNHLNYFHQPQVRKLVLG